MREALASGLFTARGTGLLGWAHQTYAEFLAARYLVRRFGEGSTDLLIQICGGNGKIVPQLYSAAAWLATLDPKVRRFVLERDPEVLLRSDLTLVDESERAILVHELLRLAARDRLIDFPRNSLRKLGHTGLADQLRPVIVDGNRPLEERALAIDIAELCGTGELGDDLVRVALDAGEPYRLRIDAAYAIAELGDDLTRRRLRPLLEETTDDPHDDLRGATLIALWPRGLTAQELIAALRPPKRRNYIGIYTMFLTRQDFSGIAPADLAALLEWAMQQSSEARRGVFDDFIDRLVASGLCRADDPEIAPALRRLLTTLLARDHSLTAGGRKKEIAHALERTDLRRGLVALLATSIVDGQLSAFDLTYSDPPLLLDEDMPWLVARLDEAAGDVQLAWAELIERGFVPHRTSHLDAVLEARERNDVLRSALAPLLDAIPLDSERAKQLRASYRKSRELADEGQADEPRRRPPPVEELLARFEEGDADAWWLLSIELVLEGKDELSEFKSDLAASPTWQRASESLRDRLLTGSIKYLHLADPSPERWFGKDRFHRPAAAGYRSLRLLREQGPERLAEVGNDVWARWAPIIVAYPAYGGSEGTAQKQLVAVAYERAPRTLRQWLVRTIEHEDNRDQEPFVLRRFDEVWDADFEATLAEIVTAGSRTPRGTAAVLGFMLEHGSARGAELAQSLFPLPPPQDAHARELALGVARLLLARVSGAFERVWRALEADADFGRALISRLAHRDEEEGRTIAQLRENELAELFTWTVRHYPYAEDPDRLEGGFLTERESIARWRDSLLHQLETRATETACRELHRISERFPELPWLRRVVARAEERALAETWVRPTPHELIALADDSDRRFVANRQQLLDLVVESLKRAQGKLTGETPQASWLWNILPNGRARPREEGDLSDWLKTHLESDLIDGRIIVNREVEIRRAPGAGIGDRTDIHIDAIGEADNGPPERIRAVIEVKGCWNRELEPALRTQLVDSYLVGAGNSVGAYVVGWFESERWDEDDHRRRRCQDRSREETQAKLVEEASALSQEHAVLIRVQALHIALPGRRSP